MNIVLIGMRGSGKTTVAKILSKSLAKEVIETDELISKKSGITIPEMVDKYGWNFFRNKETEIVKEIVKKDNVIISTGGGVVVRPENLTTLKKNGKIFWLLVSVNTLLLRIGDDPNRPSITGKKSRREDMEEIFAQRKKLYTEAADEIIDTDILNEKDVANLIIAKYENK